MFEAGFAYILSKSLMNTRTKKDQSTNRAGLLFYYIFFFLYYRLSKKILISPYFLVKINTLPTYRGIFWIF